MVVSIPGCVIWSGSITHTVLDRDPDEAVVVVGYKRCQIGLSASLPVTAAVDPNEDGQIGFGVGSSWCVDLVEFSNGHDWWKTTSLH